MKMRIRQTLAALVVSAFTYSGAALAAESLIFPDVIKANGTGDIDLLTPKNSANPPNLNAYIEGYNAWGSATPATAISFGVDINEAADGTEKATTQAITVEYAWLEVVDSSGTRNFGTAPSGTNTVLGSRFYTETKATVAKAVNNGTPIERRSYYTLIGRSGSAQITGANTVTERFDSTLKVVLPPDTQFSGVTKAVIHVRLLNTNVQSGDPEAFYDFSNGFEDIALLNKPDSDFLDSNSTILAPRALAPAVELSPEGTASMTYYNDDGDLATGLNPDEVPALSWIQKPGAGQYNLVAYEDLYPNRGDYDFNDVVVAYNYALGVNDQGQVERISGTAFLLARGSRYTHDWTLRIPVSGLPVNAIDPSSSCTVDRSTAQQAPGPVANSGCSIAVGNGGILWKALPDTVALFPGTDAGGATADVPINTQTTIRGPKAAFQITLSNPVALSNFGVDDPYILIRRVDGSTAEVHLSTKDIQNFPFAMVMPTQWKWPKEKIAIGDAYPTFLDFARSGGTTNLQWYNTPVDALVVPSWTVSDWSW